MVLVCLLILSSVPEVHALLAALKRSAAEVVSRFPSWGGAKRARFHQSPADKGNAENGKPPQAPTAGLACKNSRMSLLKRQMGEQLAPFLCKGPKLAVFQKAFRPLVALQIDDAKHPGVQVLFLSIESGYGC